MIEIQKTQNHITFLGEANVAVDVKITVMVSFVIMQSLAYYLICRVALVM